jgi:uncharacterized protein (DUF433 family)
MRAPLFGLHRTGELVGVLCVFANDQVCLTQFNGLKESHYMSNLLDRITIDPQICHGKPVIRGLRYPVETMLGLMSSGMSIDEILADYEDLERDDLLAVNLYQNKSQVN